MITKIISGGQTGADQGGLQGGYRMGCLTGGYAPKDYWTETGHAPILQKKYYLIDSEGDYAKRTHLNVEHSDGTLIVGKTSTGSLLTRSIAHELEKPYLWIKDYGDRDLGKDTAKVLSWLKQHPEIETLNVAGNRESKNPGIGKYVEDLIFAVLTVDREQARAE